MNRQEHIWPGLETTALCMVWLASILWLLVSGEYQVFLRPGFWALLIWAIVIMCLFAFSAARRISMGERPTYAPSLYIRLGTLILPLFFIIVAHEQSLGSYAFEKRAALQSYQTLQSAVRGAMPLPADNRVDILQIMENIDAWKGQRVVAEGMVYRNEKIPDRHIVVYRFLMTCCAADASPLSILVETDNPDDFEEDEWVSVEGLLSIETFDGLDTPHINADSIIPIDPPKDKYLYPSFY